MARPSNVVQIPSGADRSATGAAHTAAFPAALPMWFIRAYSGPGDVVYDPFMGSGTTLIAAHRQRRVAYGAEISPAYVDVICRRFQEATGIVPVLERTGAATDFTAAAATY